MTCYFPAGQSAANACGNDAAAVIRLLGSRFMAENPPQPFVWRTYHTQGIPCDRQACYRMDFAALIPAGDTGEICFAVADLYCPRAKQSGFFVTCLGPVRVYLNGDPVFESNGSQERSHEQCRIQVSLHEGFNRFVFRCERTRIGFGCGFANAMPQWEPCNYVLPYAEYLGEAGIAYTAPLPEDAPVDLPSFFGEHLPEGFAWLPDPTGQDRTADTEAGLYAVWYRVTLSADGRLVSPTVPLYIDGRPAQPGQIAAAGCHEVAILCDASRLSSCTRWRSAAPKDDSVFRCTLEPAVPVHGHHTGYLIAGPLAHGDLQQISSCRPGQLFQGVQGPVTWRPHLAHTVLRPYVESNLFGRWTYPLGVTLYGMWQAGLALKEPALNSYVLQHLRQVTGIHDYALYDQSIYGFPGVNQQICWLDALDDCGSFASMMLEVAPDDADSRKLADRIARYMLDEQPRTAEGAFCRRDDTIWADDMYMSGPFLCRYSILTGDSRAIDEYARQLLQYKALLYLPKKQVMSHMRCLRNGEKNDIPWCRGNGWVLFTLSELLMRLPKKHPQREELLCFFRQLTQGYIALQDGSGLWHQLLDGPETYLESSATAMFICAFARGLRYGWYEPSMGETVLHSLRRAWHGLCSVAIDCGGNLYGVCRGSGFSFSRAYYRKLMWNFNDTHGIGIVMLAGVEYLRIAQLYQ